MPVLPIIFNFKCPCGTSLIYTQDVRSTSGGGILFCTRCLKSSGQCFNVDIAIHTFKQKYLKEEDNANTTT